MWHQCSLRLLEFKYKISNIGVGTDWSIIYLYKSWITSSFIKNDELFITRWPPCGFFTTRWTFYIEVINKISYHKWTKIIKKVKIRNSSVWHGKERHRIFREWENGTGWCPLKNCHIIIMTLYWYFYIEKLQYIAPDFETRTRKHPC